MGIDVKKIYVSSWYYFQCNSLATVKSRLTKHDICWDKNELMRPVDFLEHCSVKQHGVLLTIDIWRQIQIQNKNNFSLI